MSSNLMRQYLDILTEADGQPQYDRAATEQTADNFSGLLSRLLDHNRNSAIAQQRALPNVYWKITRGDPFGERQSPDPTVTFEIPYWNEKDKQEVINYFKQEILPLKTANANNYVTQILGTGPLENRDGEPISIQIRDRRTGEPIAMPVQGLTFSFRLYN